MERRVGNVGYPRSNRFGVPTVYYTFYDSALVHSQSNAYKDGHWVGGGPFYVVHSSDTIGAPTSGMDYGVGDNMVRKPWSIWIGADRTTPYNAFSTRANLISSTNSDMAQTMSYGAGAWKRARPGNPTAGIANSLAELASEGIPNLPLWCFRRLSSFRDGFRKGGSEWLNLQFGWLPLVSDIKDMYKTYRNIDRQLADLVRQNGKGIHRRREIKNETKTTVVTDRLDTLPFQGWLGVKPPNFAMSGTTRWTETTESSERIWFAGRFRYYIPDIGSSQWTKRATRALYGANITPEVLWNALPWSWLIDYFTNVGDVMSNMSSNAVDNLTADYAFIMRETSSITTVSSTTTWLGMTQPTNNQPNESWSTGPGQASSSYVKLNRTMKSRGVASPYGFGVAYDGLSNHQYGILAALGISRWA